MKAKLVKDLPRIDRPREKLIRYGASKLTNPELLAIILRTGSKNHSVLQIAESIFKKYSSEEILSLNHSDLKRIDGLGDAKSCEVLAVIELGKRFHLNQENIAILSTKDVWNECKDIRDSMKEHFLTIYLDSRQNQIKKEVISVGTLNSSLVHPREVFEPAIINHAVGIILVHNHPSGFSEPSQADIEVTEQLVDSGKILGIEVLDHIIVTKKDWFSFKVSNLL